MLEEAALGRQRYVIEPSQKKAQSKDSDSDLTDSDDEDVIAMYKSDSMNAYEKSRPTFGSVSQLTLDTFEEHVDGAGAGVKVVLLLYRDSLKRCAKISLALQKMAEDFQYVKFVQACVDELIEDYADMGLPTLLIFEDGKQLESLVAVHQPSELGEEYSDLDLARYLYQKGILQSVQATARTRTTKPVRGTKVGRRAPRKVVAEDSDSSGSLDI